MHQRETPMTRVITSKCIGTKDVSCVDVCPVDCIHPKKDEADFARPWAVCHMTVVDRPAIA